jgi:hypothetical protein
MLIPWSQQPQVPVRIDRGHPLGAALDYLWVCRDNGNVDIIRGLPAPNSSNTLVATRQGRAVANTGGAGTAVAFQGGNRLPYIQVALGYFSSAAGNYALSELTNSGTGYLARLTLNSSTALALQVRHAFGTSRTLTITTNVGSTLSPHLWLMVSQVFSGTDYHLYADGQQASGTLDAGTFGSLDRAQPPGGGLNGGVLLTGFGFGRALPHEFLRNFTTNPANAWKLLAPRRRLFLLGVPSGSDTGAITAAAGVATTSTIAGASTAATAISAAAGAATASALAGTSTAVAAISAASGQASAATLTGASTAASAVTAAAGVATASAAAGASTAVSAISAAAGVATAGTLEGVAGTGSTIGVASGVATASTIAGASTAASSISAASGAATASNAVGASTAVAAISAASGAATASTMVGAVGGDPSAISPAAGVATAQIIVGASFARAAIGSAAGAATCSALVGSNAADPFEAYPLAGLSSSYLTGGQVFPLAGQTQR